MTNFGIESKYGMEQIGLRDVRNIYWDLTQPELMEMIVQRKEGYLSADGAVLVETGKYTGRSPKDKYIVNDDSSLKDEINWGEINCPIDRANFETILERVKEHFKNREIFVQNLAAGAEPDYRLPIRVITDKAWHSLFSRNLFIRNDPFHAADQKPEFSLIHCGDFMVEPGKYGTRTGAFVIIDFRDSLVLIGGTTYAGEIKKAIFTVLNYLLPRKDVLSMHCSANIGDRSDVSLFFGLSGTGKTSLSSDPKRQLIGDDEHGWSDNGIFNFEGGCYAKTIRLRNDLEPLIWAATNRFGSVIENVCFNQQTRQIDFDNDKLTENTRSAYPLNNIENFYERGYAGHPKEIFFLSADASGILPPIAKLDPEQASYFFLSGYTSKLAGTERGLGLEPQATFSSCFGAPFLPLHPKRYADLLALKIRKHKTNVWLVNTGWISGSYGVGQRIPLPYSRAIITTAINHLFEKVEFQKDSALGLLIPCSCPDVPAEVLNPIKTWKSKEEFSKTAENLKLEFRKNFEQYKSFGIKEII